MIMPNFKHTGSATRAADAAGAGNEGGRRPTSVPAPAASSPELVERPTRRTFTAADKLRILDELDKAAGTPGAIGAILRREGIYSSAITEWRRQREKGAYDALSPVKRGPRPEPVNPLAAEYAQLKRDNKHLERRLRQAEAVIEIQKKISSLLGLSAESNENE